MNNCIIKAIEQKIKYNYSIYYVKTYEKDGLPHFVWWNNKINSYQHYTFKGKRKPHWWMLLWYKGYTDNFPYEKLKVKLIKII